MPLSTYVKLGLGELKNTLITLQLVKVRSRYPILLGRSFFATSRLTIDLERNKLTMKIDGEIEVFKCIHDSQYKGLEKKIGNECFALFYTTPNNIDRSMAQGNKTSGKTRN
ncbi:hypothetical protein EPI10_001585 [Gossypium australe]|uniref:Uncharacterized protein n=1 Tax=Gossypium australe TaxID=47621 RepID=A0A5B6VBF4_9ROSI|nr:hypothetical protein EPI10_001585 [Gossypium australe]